MAFYEVLRAIVDSVATELGTGFSEAVYHQAILVELRERNIRYESEKIIPVLYKGHCCGNVRSDIIVDGKVIIELKAITKLRESDREQAEMYSRLLGVKEVYLVNFGSVAEIWSVQPLNETLAAAKTAEPAETKRRRG